MNSSMDKNDLCYILAALSAATMFICIAYGLSEAHLIWAIIRHS